MKFPKYKNSRRVEAKTILIMWSIFQSETNLNIKSCLEFRRTGAECIAWTFNTFHFFLRPFSSCNSMKLTFESIVDELKWWIAEKFNNAIFLLFAVRGSMVRNVISKRLLTHQLCSENGFICDFSEKTSVTTTSSPLLMILLMTSVTKSQPSP